jgi:ABC-type glycerol-3-phosphate transport system permease component
MVKPIKGLRRLSAGKSLIHLCLGVVSLVFLTPFVYVFLNSFKTTEEIYWVPQSFLPKQWILDNYLQIGEKGHFVDYFMNSVIITSTAVFLVLVISSLAGYAFARLPFKGRQLLLGFILMTITIPLVVFLIPMFLMENAAGLLNTNLGLILPNVAVVLPFAIFIMRSSFVGIPKEIEEAAEMDGCGVFMTWWRIMLPMAKNGLITVLIMSFNAIWGEYAIAKTMATDQASMPLSVGLTLMKGEVWDFGTLAAVIVLSMLPPIIIFIIFQKRLVEGITQGAVKE